MATNDPIRCRYTNCAEAHPVAIEDEQVTCETCRATLGLDPIAPYTHGAVFIDGARVAEDTLDAIIRENSLPESDAAALRSGTCLTSGGGAAPEWRIVPTQGDPSLDE